MKKIKLKKIPNKYFVTDKYYPSGNVKFKFNCINSTRKNKKQIKHIQHIQLIGANTIFFHEGVNTKRLEKQNKLIQQIGKENSVLLSQEAFDSYEENFINNKDYFIYKVSEAK